MSRAAGRCARFILLVVALAGPGFTATSLAAQKVTSSRWTMEDARGGFCVWYLVEPAAAVMLADRGTVFAAAGTGTNLPKALAQTIHDEPRFNSWIPAAICVGLYSSVTIDEEKPVHASPEQPIAIVTHFLAAQSPKGAGGSGYLLVGLFSNSRVVRNEANDRGLPVEGLTIFSGKDRGTPEDRVEFRIGSTQILWVGHPTGAPSVETTRPMSFGYAGARSTSWQGTLETTPGESHGMIGSLRVQGKSPLAKALISSPIRPTPAIELGGTARFTFQIVPPRGAGGN